VAVSGEKIRIAVVGAGFGARIQVPGFRASGRFDVVALVGRDPDRLARAAARCGVDRTCRSLEEALGLPGLHAVSITTPPGAHADGAIAAARAGLHVLCEKPMARTLAEAEAMRDAARGVVALVDHEFRFDPARATLARLITRGDLGTPRLVTAIMTMPLYVDPYRPPPAWWFDADQGGGWLGACGSHWIDALRLWLGDFADVTAAVGAHATPPAGVARQADDTYSLLFRTRGGAQGVLQQSAATWGGRFDVLRVAGSEATCWIEDGRLLRAGQDGRPAVVEAPDDLRLPDVATAPWMGPFAAVELPAFVRQAERFADLIEGRPIPEPGPATFADGVECQRVMDAARAASAAASWIRLDPPADGGKP
jgi:predicted dehydrogenase